MFRIFSRTLALLIMAALCVGPSPSLAQGADSRPIDKMAWLVGGTWVADAAAAGGGMQRIETTYDWAPNKAYIRFSTAFVAAGGSFVNYSGNFYADQSGSYSMWYMDAKGAIIQGPITVGTGSDWSSQFKDTDSTVYRVSVARGAPDAYTWTLASQAASSWNTMLVLKFVRTRPDLHTGT